MNVAFARETSDSVFEEIKPLLAAHHEEISHYPDIRLNVDYPRYLMAEQAGRLRIYTVRDGKKLVGYEIVMIGPSPRNVDSLQAHQDVLYLDPTYRRGLAGMAFVDWCDAQLREEGVQVVYQHVKAKHNFGPMLERLTYELIDHLYGRRLDR